MGTSPSSAQCCYFCGSKADSREHVPAKCFFPEDPAFREQLITVPSCVNHNQNTSTDDEYLRNYITTHHGNNSIAFKQFVDKVVKSFKIDLSKMGNPRKIPTQNETVYAFEIERGRFDRAIRKIGYALFFKEHSIPWERQLIVLTRHLVYSDLTNDDPGRLLHVIERMLPELPSNGENPEVFKYTLLPIGPNVADCIIRLTFYEGFTVWLTTEEGSNPPKL